MRTYPTGVLQNFAPPFAKPELREVGQQNWRMFSTLEDAQAGLEMIRSVVPDAEMRDANEGQYSQFVYQDEDPDIRVRLVEGITPACGVRSVLEYPSDIFDRFTQPQPFVDQVNPGQTPVLRCRAASDEIAELYWAS